jgi:alpha,alpha-trehalose phosphorylase
VSAPSEWEIAEAAFDPERLAAMESVFAVGNGYLGLRGAPEEGGPSHDPGVVLNGFHETWPIVYPEDAYGMARTGQTTVNATDGTVIRLFVDDEPFDLAKVRIVRLERVLDMRAGVLVREVECRTPRGHHLLVRSRRLASLEQRHLAAMDYEVVALDVLEFRCRMLRAARDRAAELGHPGALYPWRTIDGREASPRYASGTAQYHINADIAYAMRQYVAVSGDLDFALGEGAEVVVETARLWMDLGILSERRDGRFCINSVTGPDEYTTVVDNNAYTNLMAKENLESAVHIVECLRGQDPEAHARLVGATGLAEAELEAWSRAAELMYVPRHDELGIVLQDEHFLERKRWDFDGTPADRYPLLLHYHPLEIFRHQVIKQADVVLATYLVGHQFSAAEMRRTFDYYDPLTTGDSTLSACVQSIIASAVGYPDAALEYFRTAASVDLDDSHGNTADGIHVASCGGTWLALVAGFGGLRDYDGEVAFSPSLPAEWSGLRFRLQVRGQLVEVDMQPAGTTYRLIEGRGLPIRHFGEPLRLTPNAPLHRPATPSRQLPYAA